MGSTVKKINPAEYILSALSQKERLDAALKIAHQAFKKSKLTLEDINRAVREVRQKIRRGAYAKNRR